MIKYLGSKRTLVPLICRVFDSMPGVRSVIDLFSGTSRVGHALKRRGLRVHANDHNAYAATLARCYVQADREDVIHDATRLIAELNRLPGRAGYFTETFCVKSRFFQPKNGERIDAIREEIARKGLDPELEAVLLVSLMEAADRVDSTTGVQMAYLKEWAPRSFQKLELRVPDLLPRAPAGKGSAHQMDALEAISRLDADAAYIDPPYNQHKYLSNYHIWETLVLWDKPAVYGTACKRIDCRTRDSIFNSRAKAADAMQAVIAGVRATHLVVSFNDEGYLTREEMMRMLARRGEVLVIEQDYKRYVGAQIGIYNPRGERVGHVSHLRNTEYLYIVTPDADRIRAADLAWTGVQDLLPLEAVEEPHRRARASRPWGRPGVSPDLVERLCDLFRSRWSLTSRDAQAALGVDAATLRAAFLHLVRQGQVTMSGARRGTVYHWCPESEACLRFDLPLESAPDPSPPASFALPGDEDGSARRGLLDSKRSPRQGELF